MYKGFAELINSVKGNSPKRMAVAVAADLHTIEAALEARMKKAADPIFVGDEEKICEIITSIGARVEHYKIVNAINEADACEKAVELIRTGQADFLMKGKTETATLLKAVLNKEKGLSTGSVMSHIAVLEAPGYHKLMVVTDGGMIPYPTIEQKKAIIDNAVTALLNMGYKKPKVAALACVEMVNPKMPETVEADELKAMNLRGEIKNCVVEGPISYDCAVDFAIADNKGFRSEVCGEADVMLTPNIHVGNILAKALICTGGAKMAGFIAGAACPIVLSSRGASAEEKYLSIVVASAASKN